MGQSLPGENFVRLPAVQNQTPLTLDVASGSVIEIQERDRGEGGEIRFGEPVELVEERGERCFRSRGRLFSPDGVEALIERGPQSFVPDRVPPGEAIEKLLRLFPLSFPCEIKCLEDHSAIPVGRHRTQIRQNEISLTGLQPMFPTVIVVLPTTGNDQRDPVNTDVDGHRFRCSSAGENQSRDHGRADARPQCSHSAAGKTMESIIPSKSGRFSASP